MKYIGRIREFINFYNKKYPKNSISEAFVKNNYNAMILKERSSIMEGVMFMCDGKMLHGGLTDRIRGILSTYQITKRHDLPFYINWTTPFELAKFLLPNKVDWTINPQDIIYDANSFPAIMFKLSSEHRFMNKYNEVVFKNFFKNHKIQTHVYTNLDFANKDYSRLYDELFKPSDYLKSNIESHLSNLGENYVSFSFRFTGLLGDFKDLVGNKLSEDEICNLINRNSEELSKFLKVIPTDYRILITSDSTRFLESIKKLDNRIYIVPGNISHIDRQYQNESDMNDVWLKTFLDQYLIMKAKKVYLFKTGDMYASGFSRFAAQIGGIPFIQHEF